MAITAIIQDARGQPPVVKRVKRATVQFLIIQCTIFTVYICSTVHTICISKYL